MKTKIYKAFFGICLFILIGISSMKALSMNVIKEAFIGSAFSFRINDVIWDACPEMDSNGRLELQEMMQNHPQLNKIIHNYLCAYADYLEGDYDILQNLDNEKFFQRMNKQILKETKKRNPSENMTISDEEFIAKIRLAEEKVEGILQNQIPQNLENFGKLATMAINVYAYFTSIWVQAGLLLMMLLLTIYSSIQTDRNVMLNSYGKMFVIHGCFWAIIVSGVIKISDWRLLDIVGRILGRSMFLDCSPFLWDGIGLVVLGIVFILISKMKWRRL